MSGYTGQFANNAQDDFFDNPAPINAANARPTPPPPADTNPYQPREAETMAQFGANMAHTYQPLDVDQGYGADEQPFDYNNAGVRLGFIRKVYYIISFMLLVTFGMVAVTYFVPAVRYWQVQNYWLMIVCSVLTLIIMYVLGCFRQVARAVPWNYLLLFLFTLCMAYTVSYITAQYTGEAIIIAVGITAAVVIALSIYATCTTTDFTTCWGLMIVLGVAMLIGSIIGIFLRNRWFDVGMAVLGVITFGFYLVVDTQLVIGKNSRAYGVDDYIMAAVAIYMDIIQLFLQILRLVGQAQNQ